VFNGIELEMTQCAERDKKRNEHGARMSIWLALLEVATTGAFGRAIYCLLRGEFKVAGFRAG
jgi:hypothetical protein